jgi:hypothetical protein
VKREPLTWRVNQSTYIELKILLPFNPAGGGWLAGEKKEKKNLPCLKVISIFIILLIMKT